MKSALAISCVALSATCAEAGYSRTEQLFWHCTGRFEKNPEFGMILCAGYIDGMLEMHSVAVGLAGAKPFFCVPKDGISIDQAKRVFIKWVERNPNQMHESARVSVVVALAEAFPCKGSR